MSAVISQRAAEAAAANAPRPGHDRIVGDAGFAMGAKLFYLVTRLGLPPLVLAHITLAEYGLWAACFIIIGYIGLADLGLPSIYVRYVARLHTRGDVDGISRTLSTGIFTVGTMAAAVLVGLYLALPLCFELLKVDPAARSTATLLIIGTAAVFLADMTLGAFAYLLHGLQRIRLEQQIVVAACTLELLLIVAFLQAGFGVMALLAAYALRYAFSLALTMRQAFRLLPGLRVSPRRFDPALLREVGGFGARVQASTALSIVLHSVYRLLAGLTLGPKAIALFDLGGKIPVAAMSVPSAITRVTLPAASAIDGGADAASFGRLAQLCLGASRAISLASAIPMAFLATFAAPICRTWLGDRADLVVLPLIMTLSAVAAHLHIITGPASATFRSQGNVGNEFVYHGLRIAAIGSGVVVAFLPVGPSVTGLAWGVAGGIAAAALVYLVYSHRRLGFSAKHFAVRVLLPALVPASIAAVLCALWFAAVPSSLPRWVSLVWLAVFGLAHVVLSAIAVWGLLSVDERQRLRPILRRLMPMAIKEQ
jgi:O-antigen/teichoic acid export membrane protein